MAESRARPLHAARHIAENLLAVLEPACQRVEVAGSIRREKEYVNDIELVAIPRFRTGVRADLPPKQSSLFDAAVPIAVPVQINQVWEAIEAQGRDAILPIKPGSPTIEPDLKWTEKRFEGSRYFRLYLPRTEIKVDLFLADAATWGAIFTIRTGSADFSRALVTRWTILTRGHCKDGRFTHLDGRPEATPEEADVFRACQVRRIPPPLRLGAESLVREARR